MSDRLFNPPSDKFRFNEEAHAVEFFEACQSGQKPSYEHVIPRYITVEDERGRKWMENPAWREARFELGYITMPVPEVRCLRK